MPIRCRPHCCSRSAVRETQTAATNGKTTEFLDPGSLLRSSNFDAFHWEAKICGKCQRTFLEPAEDEPYRSQFFFQENFDPCLIVTCFQSRGESIPISLEIDLHMFYPWEFVKIVDHLDKHLFSIHDSWTLRETSSTAQSITCSFPNEPALILPKIAALLTVVAKMSLVKPMRVFVKIPSHWIGLETSNDGLCEAQFQFDCASAGLLPKLFPHLHFGFVTRYCAGKNHPSPRQQLLDRAREMYRAINRRLLPWKGTTFETPPLLLLVAHFLSVREDLPPKEDLDHLLPEELVQLVAPCPTDLLPFFALCKTESASRPK